MGVILKVGRKDHRCASRQQAAHLSGGQSVTLLVPIRFARQIAVRRSFITTLSVISFSHCSTGGRGDTVMECREARARYPLYWCSLLWFPPRYYCIIFTSLYLYTKPLQCQFCQFSCYRVLASGAAGSFFIFVCCS